MEQNQIRIKIISLILLATLSGPAYAYLDPGTGSIIFQAIIASVIVGFASIKLWWNKLLNLFISHNNDKKPKKKNTKNDEVTVIDHESEN